MPFQIIQDTREQSPLRFKTDDALTGVVEDTLSYGDYAARLGDGKLCPVRFERKSLGDLYSTLTHGYQRFRREITRAKEDGSSLILIVEATLTDVALGYQYSTQEPRSLIRRIFSVWMHHDLYPVFCRDRQEMAAYIKCFYEAFEKDLVRKTKTVAI